MEEKARENKSRVLGSLTDGHCSFNTAPLRIILVMERTIKLSHIIEFFTQPQHCFPLRSAKTNLNRTHLVGLCR